MCTPSPRPGNGPWHPSTCRLRRQSGAADRCTRNVAEPEGIALDCLNVGCRSADRPLGRRWRMRGGKRSGPHGCGSWAIHGAAPARPSTREAGGVGAGNFIRFIHWTRTEDIETVLPRGAAAVFGIVLWFFVYRLGNLFAGVRSCFSLPCRAFAPPCHMGTGLSRAGYAASPCGRNTAGRRVTPQVRR